METPSIKVTVDATTWSQAPSLGSLNTVLIRISQKTEEFLINETDGLVSSLGSYPSSSLPDRRICLKLSDFAPDNVVYQHLSTRIHDRVLSQLISDRIVVESERRDLPQGPLFMKLSVDLTHKSYIVVPCSTSVPYKSDSESETCAICLEDLWEYRRETDSITQLPHCIHLFHETCLLKWFDRGNATCPLCRQGVDNNQSKEAVESN